MTEGRRLKAPEWGSLSSSLKQSLRDFLPQDISVTVVEERKEERELERLREFRMLCLTLEGPRLRKLAAEFDPYHPHSQYNPKDFLPP